MSLNNEDLSIQSATLAAFSLTKALKCLSSLATTGTSAFEQLSALKETLNKIEDTAFSKLLPTEDAVVEAFETVVLADKKQL